MSKKKNRRVIPKVSEKTTFVDAVRRTRMSRMMLFVIIFTSFLVLYGVYAVFAAGLSGPTEAVTETVDRAVQTVESAGIDLGSSGGNDSGCACCGGSQEEIKGAAVVKGNVQELTIQVNGGYDPNVIEVKKGIPLKLTFERHSSGGCDAQISIPAISVLEDLPTDGTVTYDIPVPSEVGQVIDFTCGMNMLSGQIRVIE